MLNEQAYIEVEKHLREANIKSGEHVAAESGKSLADLWLKNKAKTIDLWGGCWWGEEFVNAFLQRVMEVEGSIKEVDEIQWYFGCETFNFGPPCYFQNAIWIKNFLSKEKIDWHEESGSDESDLERLANGLSYYNVEGKKFMEILEEIEIDENNQIKNAKYIREKIIGLKVP